MQRQRKAHGAASAGNSSATAAPDPLKSSSSHKTSSNNNNNNNNNNNGPPLHMLRCALMLPLLTLAVILTAGIYAVPHHIDHQQHAHPLHKVVLQAHQQPQLSSSKTDPSKLKTKEDLIRQHEALQEKIKQQQKRQLNVTTKEKNMAKEKNTVAKTDSKSSKNKPKQAATPDKRKAPPPSFNATNDPSDPKILKFSFTALRIQHTPKVPAEISSKNVKYHLIFSTGCSAFQDWQSYLFFYYAKQSQQPGDVTRIVSGCSTADQAKLQSIFDEQIAPMKPGQFHIHFTPDFSHIKPGINYKYFNKPFGTQHWLEQKLGYTQTSEGLAPENPDHDDTIVILLDPDQIVLRPWLNNDFATDTWKFLDKEEKPLTAISHGQPMAQMYGFSTQWKTKVTMEHVARFDSPSVIDTLSNKQAEKSYIVGPPYIATARDMYAISRQWSVFAPRVHDQYPHLLAEMFAYSLAAAHLKLPHQTAHSFMTSSPAAAYSEGWDYVDQLPDNVTCVSAKEQPATVKHSKEKDIFPQPRVFHFCQRYNWGPYFFGKQRFPKDFLTCDSPLLVEPPWNLLTAHTKMLKPPNGAAGSERDIGGKNPSYPKRLVYGVCTMLFALNEAAMYYKQQHCEGSSKVNWNKGLVFVKTQSLFQGANFTLFKQRG